MSGIDEARRTSFGSVAAQYDAARPSYPQEMVDFILSLAGAAAGDQALEVGAGTGKATALFAARGLRITAVEPSEEMATVARRHVEGADVRFQIGRLEDVPVPEATFKLVFSGQAWHWVTPGIGEDIAARALLPGGVLACFWNRVDWSRCPVREALDGAYEAVGWDAIGPANPKLGLLEFETPWIERTALCAALIDPSVQLFEWTERYSADEYVALLGTHSDHILLEDAKRARLFGGVRRVIADAGGVLELVYSTELCLARAV